MDTDSWIAQLAPSGFAVRVPDGAEGNALPGLTRLGLALLDLSATAAASRSVAGRQSMDAPPADGRVYAWPVAVGSNVPRPTRCYSPLPSTNGSYTATRGPVAPGCGRQPRWQCAATKCYRPSGGAGGPARLP